MSARTGCPECRRRKSSVTMARDDLRHAARHAARRESPRLLADVEKAKRQLAEAQHIADEHAATHVESAQVAA